MRNPVFQLAVIGLCALGLVDGMLQTCCCASLDLAEVADAAAPEAPAPESSCCSVAEADGRGPEVVAIEGTHSGSNCCREGDGCEDPLEKVCRSFSPLDRAPTSKVTPGNETAAVGPATLVAANGGGAACPSATLALRSRGSPPAGGPSIILQKSSFLL